MFWFTKVSTNHTNIFWALLGLLGLVKAIGLSNFNSKQVIPVVMKRMMGWITFDCNNCKTTQSYKFGFTKVSNRTNIFWALFGLLGLVKTNGLSNFNSKQVIAVMRKVMMGWITFDCNNL